MSILLQTQKAVFEKLDNNSALMELVSGVYDYVPQTVDMPYVTIGNFQSDITNSLEAKDHNLRGNIYIYAKSVGRKEVLDIGQLIIAELDDQSLEIEGCEHVITSLLAINADKLSDQVYRGVLSFKIIVRE